MRKRERMKRYHRGCPQHCGNTRPLGITKHHRQDRLPGGMREYFTPLTESDVKDSALCPSSAHMSEGRNLLLILSDYPTERYPRKAMGREGITPTRSCKGGQRGAQNDLSLAQTDKAREPIAPSRKGSSCASVLNPFGANLTIPNTIPRDENWDARISNVCTLHLASSPTQVEGPNKVRH